MASNPVISEAGETKRLVRRWMVLAAVLLLLAAIFLPPLINLNRYQHRIAASISGSLGRPVEMSSVSLRLFPLPALALSGFVVEDEPDYGAEPMLQADSVTAYPRISSLWRGRLEVARIDLDHASLNLVRKTDGGWNFAPVLVKAAQVRQAPTGQRHPGGVLRFPYIQASHSRINFKFGQEKKPFSFVDSDLSVWLENSGEWGVNFKARPARTNVEMDQQDTGTLRMEGKLRRAPDLDQMPLDLHVRWTDAPLGQLSRILLGHDSGWRGSFDLIGRIQGSAGEARIHSAFHIAQLHRAEFMPDRPLELQASCDAVYRKSDQTVGDITCLSPVGGGRLRLTGAIASVDTQPHSDLALAVDDVPASALVAALGEVRSGVTGVRAEGTLQGVVSMKSSPQDRFSGKLRMNTLSILLPGSSRPYVFTPVEFLCEGSGALSPNGNGKHAALLLQPVRLPMGGASPLIMDGRLTSEGFEFHVRGEGSVAALHGLNDLVAWSGVSAIRTSRAALAPKGTTKLDLDLHGPWVQPIAAPDQPLAPITVTGSIAIQNGELIASYLPQPLRILSAEALLSPEDIAWTNVSINYDGLQAQGTFEYPSLCAPAEPCAARFHIFAKSIDLAKIQKTLGGEPRSGDLWRDLLSKIDGSHPPVWPTLEGSVAAASIAAGPLEMQNATGALKISENTLDIQSLNGRVLGGAMHLAGTMKFLGGRPEYRMAAQVEGASAPALAALFRENWGGGRLDLSGQWRMAGWTNRQLSNSAEGTFHWNWIRNHAERASFHNRNHPFQFIDWSGDANFKNRSLKIIHSRLNHETRVVPLTGTISFDRVLRLTNSSESHPMKVTGTLQQPEVTTSPQKPRQSRR